jgi:fucokinase
VTSAAWDYLVVTASSEEQASAYRSQLALRMKLGFIPRVREVLAVPDPGGKRVGSGGSTIHCLLQILNRELGGSAGIDERAVWLEALSRLRILIIHAGGDSRRIPAYGACGKVFIPVPGESDRALGMTLLDRQLPTYLGLPSGAPGRGQVIVTSGDVLLTFDNTRVRFSEEGITALGCYVPPELAANHGVICPDDEGRVRLFLQKPSPALQREKGAANRRGQSVLDIGVMSLDARTALQLIDICEVERKPSGQIAWAGAMADDIEERGLDFYREICCALGTEATVEDYVRSVRGSGSKLEEPHLQRVFEAMAGVPFAVSTLPQCGFLHFGTSRQLIESGNDLLSLDYGTSRAGSFVDINNVMAGDGHVVGANAWVEGCRVGAALTLGGENVVVGADVRSPLSLPPKSVIDVLEGRDRRGGFVRFVRCYGVDDVFHRPAARGAKLAGLPLSDWLKVMEASEADIWSAETPSEDRLAWNARIFPAVDDAEGYRDWLWMLEPAKAAPEMKALWRKAERYSFAEMAGLASQEAFHRRRLVNRAEEIRGSLRRIFRPESGFSAAELAFILKSLNDTERRRWVAEILRVCGTHFGDGKFAPGLEQLELSRILHTLGSAILKFMKEQEIASDGTLSEVYDTLSQPEKEALSALGLPPELARNARTWAQTAQEKAFEHIGRTIVLSMEKLPKYPRSALRADEIIWGRAPARLDLGGGWSDTPPYSLEHGGCVINAAVNLNGQPPIHAYARVIEEPEIRIISIDHGARIAIRELSGLLDYRSPESEFGLAKATLALSGFSLEHAEWPQGVNTLKDMLRLFGGGIELTTLAAIPSGSGLGTSSIMGAVLMAVVHRLAGRRLTPRELFHNVLRLEQELTTGGGWQDQIGGALGGVKMITTEPGLIPDPRIYYVPDDVLNPRTNGGQTLLYYTGLRRLAKNILHYVVGNYLDRERAAMDTLRRLHSFPPLMVEAMASKDMMGFGELIDVAWNLNKEIDPDSTTVEIEAILERIRPHMFGAKLLGAGGGGFLLIVCKSPADAQAARAELEGRPPNDRARFFDFDISSDGLAVTTC